MGYGHRLAQLQSSAAHSDGPKISTQAFLKITSAVLFSSLFSVFVCHYLLRLRRRLVTNLSEFPTVIA